MKFYNLGHKTFETDFNLSHMDSHALSPFGSDLKAYVLEATKTWHVQHKLCDCRCDTVIFWYNDNVLTRVMEQN